MEDWHEDPEVVPLEEGARGSGERRGEVGLATFPAGDYPACSIHGAMNRLGKDRQIWRCLAFGCNAGAEWKPDPPLSFHGPEVKQWFCPNA